LAARPSTGLFWPDDAQKRPDLLSILEKRDPETEETETVRRFSLLAKSKGGFARRAVRDGTWPRKYNIHSPPCIWTRPLGPFPFLQHLEFHCLCLATSGCTFSPAVYREEDVAQEREEKEGRCRRCLMAEDTKASISRGWCQPRAEETL